MREVINGWSASKEIKQSRNIGFGENKCDKCSNAIYGNHDMLYVVLSNWRHRGNETDEVYMYHRECSSEDETWSKFDASEIEFRERQIKRAIAKKELLPKIKEFDFNAEELFDLDYIKSHIW